MPVKFSLGGDYGLKIFVVGCPASQKVVCDSGAPVDDIEETVQAGDSSLSCGGGRYSYVWKTNKSWSGTCRQLILRTLDGSYHRANFKFK